MIIGLNNEMKCNWIENKNQWDFFSILFKQHLSGESNAHNLGSGWVGSDYDCAGY